MEQVQVKTGAQLLIEALNQQNVELIFGYPGGTVLGLYDALYDAKIKHILTRHEQGAIHAAEGYAKSTKKTGVVIATSGPGATNLITGLADAMMDSVPLVVFTGQVGTDVIGTDAFQEADILGITMPITKHNYQVRNVEDIPQIINEAFHIASTGRKGPVVIDLPRDFFIQKTEKEIKHDIDLPGYAPTYQPNRNQIDRLVEVLKESKRPVIVAGAGIILGKASEELRAFAQKFQIPVVHTLLGLGGFPASHPLYLGMGGMHGTYTANYAMHKCDLLINLGSRFDDRLTGNLAHFAKSATIAHLDIDPAEIGKIIPTDIPIVCCVKNGLTELLKADFQKDNHMEWVETLLELKDKYPYKYKKEEGLLKPQEIVEAIYELSSGDATVVSDVGQNQMFSAQYYLQKQPNKWVTSGGLGTMGYGLPAAIGAQFGNPDELVIAFLGDGGFQMTLQELGVIQEYQLPIKIVILNNRALGMVRQWQDSFYNKRYSHSLFPTQPDFSLIAKAYGIGSVKIEDSSLAFEELRKALAMEGPVLIECLVSQEEKVLPMVPPGKGIHQMEGVFE